MIVSVSELQNVRAKHKDKKIVIGFGSFDLFHFEHLEYLLDAKALGDILVVAIKPDKFVALKNEGRPIVCESQRAAIVDNIKCVDYVVIANDESDIAPLKNKYQITDNSEDVAYWTMFYKVYENLKPDILYYEEGHAMERSRAIYLKEKGIEAVSRPRRAIISTTKIIEKIKGDKKC